MFDPWSYAAKTRNEYAEQVALFMWAGMAQNFGVIAANDLLSYTLKGYALSFGTGIIRSAPDCLPQLEWLHAIKNQGHGDAIRGAMSKAEGVRAGVPDICLPVPIGDPWNTGFPNGGRLVRHCGLYIELKRLKSARGAAGKTSPDQNKWISYLRGAGYKVDIAIGWEQARDCLLAYLGYPT